MRVFAAALLACAAATPAQGQGRPFTVEDLLSLEQVGHAAFSSDERWLVYEAIAPWKTAPAFDRDFLVEQGLGRLMAVDLSSAGPPRPLLAPASGASWVLGPTRHARKVAAASAAVDTSPTRAFGATRPGVTSRPA